MRVARMVISTTKTTPIAAGAQCESTCSTARGTIKAPTASIAIWSDSTNAKMWPSRSSRETR